MAGRFRVGLAPELLDASGKPTFGEGPLAVLDDAPEVERAWLPERYVEIPPALALDYDAIYLTQQRVTRASVARAAEGRLKVVARHGVGYDSVDVAAMTEAGVIVTNTPFAIRRPVATIAMTFVLALAGHLFTKDRLTRTGRWHERVNYMGTGLTGRRLGIVGGGGIARELVPLARAFDLRVAVADPYVPAADIEKLGATLVPLDTMMAESDFVVVACLLNDETRGLINAEQLARMKRSAYLINVARGPIVYEPALIEALRAGRIAGAALDVFTNEPVENDNPLLAMHNVIVTPHALCWTDECFGNIAREGFDGLVSLARGAVPANVVDRAVLSHPRVRAWLSGRGLREP
jgi:phosphoglycerate dehydrogenase-like enzyme